MSLETAKQLLDYDPETGMFTWLVRRSSNALPGQEAGMHDPDKGYVRLRIGGQIYFAHRVAWWWIHGQMPIGEIDHINGVKADNRIANLRECTRAQNGSNLRIKSNNTSGAAGVSWDKRRERWHAYINPNGKRRHVGYFSEIQTAINARRAAELAHFGEYVRG